MMAALFTPSALPPDADAAHPLGSPVKAVPPPQVVPPQPQVVPEVVPQVVPPQPQVVPPQPQVVPPQPQVVPPQPQVVQQWGGHNAPLSLERTGRPLDSAFRGGRRTSRQPLTEAQRDAISRFMLGQVRPSSERVQFLSPPRLRGARKAVRHRGS